MTDISGVIILYCYSRQFLVGFGLAFIIILALALMVVIDLGLGFVTHILGLEGGP